MNTRTFARRGLLATQAFVALTALGGGVALILSSLSPDLGSVLSPPAAYLEGSPFASYLIPGIILAVVLGGVHILAFVMLLARRRWAIVASAAAGFATLIWIFVQMVVIPFSFLQVIYFAAGLLETGLVMLALGIFEPGRMPHRERTTANTP